MTNQEIKKINAIQIFLFIIAPNNDSHNFKNWMTKEIISKIFWLNSPIQLNRMLKYWRYLYLLDVQREVPYTTVVEIHQWCNNKDGWLLK